MKHLPSLSRFIEKTKRTCSFSNGNQRHGDESRLPSLAPRSPAAMPNKFVSFTQSTVKSAQRSVTRVVDKLRADSPSLDIVSSATENESAVCRKAKQKVPSEHVKQLARSFAESARQSTAQVSSSVREHFPFASNIERTDAFDKPRAWIREIACSSKIYGHQEASARTRKSHLSSFRARSVHPESNYGL